jgi:hypothetical protein
MGKNLTIVPPVEEGGITRDQSRRLSTQIRDVTNLAN